MARNVILGKIVVHPSAERSVGHRLLVQRHPDAHHDSAEDLAAHRLPRSAAMAAKKRSWGFMVASSMPLAVEPLAVETVGSNSGNGW
ncbi:MAG: hypothetical protein AB7G13_34345 [Lautropia sp.]